MNQKVTRRDFLYVFFGLLLSIIPLALGFAQYQTNDDRILEQIANGILYGTSSSNLVYISDLIGSITQLLFELNSNINWFFLFYVMTQSLALVLFLALNVESRHKIVAVIVILANYQLFYSYQYTQVALTSAAIGALGYFFSKSKIIRHVGIILVLISFLWRPNAALLGILIILFLIITFNHAALRKKNFFILLLITALSFIIGTLTVSNTSMIKNDPMREFSEFNQARERVQGYQPFIGYEDYLQEKAKEIGWSRNDYILSQYKSYAFDNDIYNVLTFTFLSSNRIYEPKFEHYFLTLQNLFIKFYTDYFIELLLFCLVLILFVITGINLNKNEVIITIFGIAITFYSLLLLGKLPERLVWPILFSFLAGTLVIRSSSTTPIENKISFFKIMNILLIVSLSINFHYKQISLQTTWQRIALEQQLGIERVLNYNSDKPIVAFPSFYNYIWRTKSPSIKPGDTPPVWDTIIPIGWVAQSPDMNQFLKDQKLSKDLFSSVASGDAYLAVGTIEDLQIATQFLLEHHDTDVKWPATPFVYTDSGLSIWKVSEE